MTQPNNKMTETEGSITETCIGLDGICSSCGKKVDPLKHFVCNGKRPQPNNKELSFPEALQKYDASKMLRSVTHVENARNALFEFHDNAIWNAVLEEREAFRKILLKLQRERGEDAADRGWNAALAAVGVA
jgi:hypothetical protein